MGPGVRPELDAARPQLGDFGGAEQRLLEFVRVPRVGLADQIGNEEYRGDAAVTLEQRPRDLVGGPVAVVEGEDHRATGEGARGPLAAAGGEPRDKRKRLITPSEGGRRAGRRT